MTESGRAQNVAVPDQFVAGLVGMPGSGKSQIAKFLRICGFPVIRLGGFVEDEVIARGLPPGPSSEAIIRDQLREEFGKEVLARRVLESLPSDHSTLLFVLDGVYSPEEDQLFRAELSSSYFTIAVLCDRSIRYGRLENRDRRRLTNEEALTRDLQEIGMLRKADTIALADHFVLNNEGLRELLNATFEMILNHVSETADPKISAWLSASTIDLNTMIEAGQSLLTTDLWILIARAQMADDPLLTWHVCRLIGDNSYLEGVHYLRSVCQSADVAIDQSSLHQVAAWSLEQLE